MIGVGGLNREQKAEKRKFEKERRREDLRE
jgi:hypothetical protein